MLIDGRVFRGLLEVLSIWSRTGQLVEGSNFCRLSAPGGESLAVEFPTKAGWFSISVPAVAPEFAVAGGECFRGLDLPLLQRVLKASSWPKGGSVGDVELVWDALALRVRVPSWRQVRGEWLEAPAGEFVYPRGQGVCWDPGALPGAPELGVGRSVSLERSALEAAVVGASSCAATGSDRGILRCVELVCRPDEVIGIATDGGQAALCSEPAGLSIEEQYSVPLPLEGIRAALAIWSKLKLDGEVDLLEFVDEGGQRLLLLVLGEGGGGPQMTFLLKLQPGHLPLDVVEKLPQATAVPVGRADCREEMLRELGIAAWNPSATAAWLVWEGGCLHVRSHGPFLDTSASIGLMECPSEPLEMALETARLSRALEQLKAAGGSGPISFFVDDIKRPTRVLLRQSDPGSGQVRQVVVLATAGVSYETFRVKAAELAAASAKTTRREAAKTPIAA